MSLVNILNVEIQDAPVPFLSGFVLEITFECLQELREHLEFFLIFVGSSSGNNMDQELDSIEVGPVPVGINKFVMQSNIPDINKLNPKDVMDYTAVFLKCQYRGREFLRCSYLVKAEYDNEEMHFNPPPSITYERLIRRISDKPKVTRFPIPWDGEEDMPPPQPEADSMPALGLEELYNPQMEDEEEYDDENGEYELSDEDEQDDTMDMEEMEGAK